MINFMQKFSLLPFDNSHCCSELVVKGEISRTADFLYLNFCLSGNVGEIVLPQNEYEPERRDNLWEATCVECFIKLENSERYYEFNLSPNGCWNLYRFDGYRKGMITEYRLKAIATKFYIEDDHMVIRTSFSLDGLVAPEEMVRVGVSCVLLHPDTTKSYWALSHAAGQPDFHHPESFLLRL